MTAFTHLGVGVVFGVAAPGDFMIRGRMALGAAEIQPIRGYMHIDVPRGVIKALMTIQADRRSIVGSDTQVIGDLAEGRPSEQKGQEDQQAQMTGAGWRSVHAGWGMCIRI